MSHHKETRIDLAEGAARLGGEGRNQGETAEERQGAAREIIASGSNANPAGNAAPPNTPGPLGLMGLRPGDIHTLLMNTPAEERTAILTNVLLVTGGTARQLHFTTPLQQRRPAFPHTPTLQPLGAEQGPTLTLGLPRGGQTPAPQVDLRVGMTRPTTPGGGSSRRAARPL